jgi:hypothetical protein
LLRAPVAWAGEPPARDDRAQADAEFAEAKVLMDAGQVAMACVKFARSELLDPRLGRLLNLAFCHEQEGKTASAWREYNDAMALAEQKGQAEREDFARDRASAVAKKLAFVHFDIPENAATVRVDGAVLAREAWSAPMPFDPGEHTIVLTAPGKKPRNAILMVGNTPGMQLFALAPLEDEVAPAAPNPAVDSPVSPVASPPPVERIAVAPAARTSANLVPAYVATAATGVSLAFGAVFGIDAIAKKNEADRLCPGKACIDSSGSQRVADARSAATVSTVGFAVAGVGAVVAVWLFLRAGDAGEPRARVVPIASAEMTGVRLQGAW